MVQISVTKPQVLVATPRYVPVVGGTGRVGSVTVAPTVTAAAYAAGNVVGGKMTFGGMVDSSLSGLLIGAKIKIKSVQTSAFKLYLFKADPTASTFNDKAAPVLAPADVGSLIGVVPFTVAESGLGTHTLYSVDNLSIEIVTAGQVVCGVLVAVGTPTFASTGDVAVELLLRRD